MLLANRSSGPELRSIIWLLIHLVIYLAIVRWLVGISWWLDWYLASFMTGTYWLHNQLRQLRERVSRNKVLFDINDGALVETSALALRLEETVDNLELNVNELMRKIEEVLAKIDTVASFADLQCTDVLSHPELRMIEKRIKAIQEKPPLPKGSFEAWERSEAVFSLIALYEAKRAELKQRLDL